MPHRHRHHSPLPVPLWMVHRLTKSSAHPTMPVGQTLQHWNLTRLHLGHRRRRGEFFRLLNLYDSGAIAFRIPNYRPHQTPILPADRYRPGRILLQPSHVLNSTLKRRIRRTVPVAWAIIHMSKQMPRRSTSKSFQLATLTPVLNPVSSHAVASQLTASSVVSAQTQPGYLERYGLDILPERDLSQCF